MVWYPLGTSRKKHKITAVYVELAKVPPELQSSLTSIHLAILSNPNDVQTCGYGKVLEPLLKDLVTLEQEGVFSLGKNIKGNVHCVAADILGPHSVGLLCGLLEGFSG